MSFRADSITPAPPASVPPASASAAASASRKGGEA